VLRAFDFASDAPERRTPVLQAFSFASDWKGGRPPMFRRPNRP
jgi:hypothetical protein